MEQAFRCQSTKRLIMETITSLPKATFEPYMGPKLEFPHQKKPSRKKRNLAKMMMLHIDTTITQSILTSSITIW